MSCDIIKLWISWSLLMRLKWEMTRDKSGWWSGNPLQYSCLEKSHGQRSLVGCSPWGCWAEHDWVTSLSLFTFMHWRRKWQPTPVFLPGESQGQGAWWAAVSGVAQSRTRLKRLSIIISSSSRVLIMQVERKDGWEIYPDNKTDRTSCLLVYREMWERKDPKMMVRLHWE